MHTISVSVFGSGDCSSIDLVLEINNTFASTSVLGSVFELHCMYLSAFWYW